MSLVMNATMGRRRPRKRSAKRGTATRAVAVARSPQEWAEACFARIARVRKAHAEQRRKLEADIESHPLEPQMSGQVCLCARVVRKQYPVSQ